MATETAPAGLYGSSARDERGMRGGARARAVRIGRVVLIALIGLGIGYVLGRVQGSFAVRDVETQLADARSAIAAERTTHEAALADAQRARAAAEARAQTAMQEAEARNQALTTSLELHRGAHLVARARTALDARNFGIAEEHLRSAESVLAPLTSSVPGLVQVVVAIAETRVVVAEDLERQRAALDALVEQMDSVLASVDAQRAPATSAQGPAEPGTAAPPQPTPSQEQSP